MKKLIFGIYFLLTSIIVFGLEYTYGDTLETIRRKNPGVTFTDIGYEHGYQYKSIEGQYLTTTETQLTFDQRGRLFNVVMTRRGAALDVYNPLVEKYTRIYGRPRELSPLTTNLNRGISSATSSFENDRGSVVLLLIIPLDGVNIPYVMIIESYKYDESSNNSNNNNSSERSTWSPQNSSETAEQVAVMSTYNREQMVRSNPEMRVNATGGLSWQIGTVGGEAILSFLEYDTNGKLIKYYILLPYSENRLISLVESGGMSRNELPRQRSRGDIIDLGAVYRNNNVEITCKIVLELTPTAFRNLGGSGPEYVRPEYSIKYLN